MKYFTPPITIPIAMLLIVIALHVMRQP